MRNYRSLFLMACFVIHYRASPEITLKIAMNDDERIV